MPCCTYLDEHKCTAATSDAELNELLADVRAATGEDWRIREMIYERRRLFRKPIAVKRYELLVRVQGIEFQSVNFYRPDQSDDYLPSINLSNDAGYVAAYLYGVLAGVQKASQPK